MAFDESVVGHWLERKIAQNENGSTDKDLSYDRPLHRFINTCRPEPIRMGDSAQNANDSACAVVEILPYAVDFLQYISTKEIIGIVVCCGLTLIILVMFSENVWFLVKNITCERTRNLSVWQIGLHPVIATLSMLAVVVPRSSILCDLVATVYISICIHIFLTLIVTYHGGSEKMLIRMSGDKIPLRSPPLACCCCCCPTIAVTRQNYSRIKLCVIQIIFLRPVLIFIAAALWTDGRYKKGGFSGFGAESYINIIGGLSTIVAMYGLILIYRVSRRHLKMFHLVPKFINLQLVLTFNNLQQFIFTGLQQYHLPACKGILSTAARGNALNHMILIAEMFLLALLARCYYRRREAQPETISEMGNDIVFESNSLKHNDETTDLTSIDGVYKKIETEQPVSVHMISQ